MEKDISVKVSREGNITMIVPELENKLSVERASLIVALVNGAIEDSKELVELWAKSDSIIKPYNSTGRKVSEVASKVRPINENEPLPEGVVSDEVT